jgi:hypothetical protein
VLHAARILGRTLVPRRRAERRASCCRCGDKPRAYHCASCCRCFIAARVECSATMASRVRARSGPYHLLPADTPPLAPPPRAAGSWSTSRGAASWRSRKRAAAGGRRRLPAPAGAPARHRGRLRGCAHRTRGQHAGVVARPSRAGPGRTRAIKSLAEALTPKARGRARPEPARLIRRAARGRAPCSEYARRSGGTGSAAFLKPLGFRCLVSPSRRGGGTPARRPAAAVFNDADCFLRFLSYHCNVMGSAGGAWLVPRLAPQGARRSGVCARRWAFSLYSPCRGPRVGE